MIHTVKGFNTVSEAGVGVFLEFSCFLYNPKNVGDLITGFSAFTKLYGVAHSPQVNKYTVLRQDI